ncbi:lipase (class 2) [Halohasta litchfieldiae]|uniref:Lipase (Class 2) n=1 Tax=Halohasta litchfieldiae TaxID=1073996 RepID=A0A1H6RSC8_9EURY|nr:lipase (class 2) [Halohasta litchfieldiae]SEI58649.1 Lipase (class 2) [Halohasta litchfieldiae]
MYPYIPACEHVFSLGISQSARYQQAMFDLCFSDTESTDRRSDHPSDRVDDAQLPWETAGQYGGWGGHEWFGTAPGTTQVPVVFVHGNQCDASDWTETCEQFIEAGYRGDDLWAITFAESTPTHAEMAAQLDEFVAELRSDTGAESVMVVAHSLGVTGVRYWLSERDRYDWVETFVGLAGANHGVSWATLCCKSGLDSGPFQVSGFLRDDYDRYTNHPLSELNDNETPGEIDYYTIRGRYDSLFWVDQASPRLDGAVENVVLPTDHNGVRDSAAAVERIFSWVTPDACGA